jgi:hypothetical protein
MADSILDSTKKILGLSSDYTPFDLDIITHLNSAFSTLSQLGVGPEDGFYITDSEPTWDDFLAPENQLNMVKTYVFLKVRMMFDPPSTSYLIEAMNQQILEHEWRLNAFREVLLTEQGVPAEELPLLSVLDGGDP